MSSAPSARLSTLDGIALIVSNVIGGGIFIVPALVARGAPSPAVALALWGLGGLVAMAGALSYARLAAAVPRSGGEYAFLRAGMGSLPAFLSGWTSLVAGFSGAIAAGALALVQYASRFAPSLADDTRLGAVAVVCAFAVLHGAGLAPGRLVQRVLTVAKLAGLILLVAFGAASTPPPAVTAVASGTMSLAPAFIAILFCYSGWNAAAYVTEEMRGGARAVAVALVAGTAIVTALYVVFNALLMARVPFDRLAAADDNVLAAMVDMSGGSVWSAAFAAVAILSIAASVSAMTIAGPRIYFAMARDGVFFAWAGKLTTRDVPRRAIWVQAAVSSALIATGTFEQLVELTGAVVTLFAALAVACLWRLPSPPNGWRWGWAAPAFFVAASSLMLVAMAVARPGVALGGVAVVSVGAAAYGVARRNRESLRGRTEFRRHVDLAKRPLPDDPG